VVIRRSNPPLSRQPRTLHHSYDASRRISSISKTLCLCRITPHLKPAAILAMQGEGEGEGPSLSSLPCDPLVVPPNEKKQALRATAGMPGPKSHSFPAAHPQSSLSMTMMTWCLRVSCLQGQTLPPRQQLPLPSPPRVSTNGRSRRLCLGMSAQTSLRLLSRRRRNKKLRGIPKRPRG
jgi:hypothetical protein